MSIKHQFCTFYLDKLLFGIEVEKVQEIIRFQQMTRVPLASDVVEGLINLRGQIVTAIDLRRRLEFDVSTSERLPTNVVIRTEDGAISLLVDEIGDVLEVDEEIFERPPDTLKGVAKDLILGAYKLQNRLLLILDTSKTVNLNNSPAA